MIKIIRLSLVIWISLVAVGANGQKKAVRKAIEAQQNNDKTANDALGKIFGKAVNPPKEYIEAEAIVQQAIQALNNVK